MADNLQTAQKNWTYIQNVAKQAGAPDSAWKKLATVDFQRVLQGHNPMSRSEALDAVTSSIRQQANVAKQQTGGGPLDEVGNFFSDIAHIPFDFPIGMFNYAKSLPEQIGDLPSFIKGDPQTFAKYGAVEPREGGAGLTDVLLNELHNAGHIPVLSPLIPGLHTLSSLATPSGRKEIAAHPGYAAVDVITAASAAGHAGLFGEGAVEGTPTEALQRGKPVRALGRAIGDVTPGFDRPAFNAWIDRAGLSSRIINDVMRPLGELNRKAKRSMIDFLGTDVMTKLAALPSNRRVELADFAYNFKPEDTAKLMALPANEQAIVGMVRDLNDTWVHRQVANGDIAMVPDPTGRPQYYAADADVVRAYRKQSRAADLHATSTARLQAAEDQVSEREARLADRQGKVRRYGESDESFGKRQESAVGLHQVHEATFPLIEAFRDLDPRRIFQIKEGTSPQALAALHKYFSVLEGEKGHFAKLDEAFQAGDLEEVRKQLTNIHRIIKRPTFDAVADAARLRQHFAEMHDELVGLSGRSRAHGYAARTLRTAQDRLARRQIRHQTIKSILDARTSDFIDLHTSKPPASFFPIINKAIRESAVDHARMAYTGQQLTTALRGISEAASFNELKMALPDWDAHLNDFTKQWLDLARQGYNPIWLHDVNSAALDSVLSPAVLKDHYYEPSQFHDVAFNMGRSMHNIMASVQAAGAELIRADVTREFIDKHLGQHIKTWDELNTTYRDVVRKTPELRLEGETIEHAARRLAKDDYAPFNPDRYGFTRYIHKQGEVLLPKGIANSIDMVANERGIPIVGKNSPLTKTFKFAVLTGPRHMAHVVFGGLAFGALREPGMFLKMSKAMSLIKDGHIPDELNQTFDIVPDHLYAIQSGKTIGRLMTAIKRPAEWMQTIEEHFTNMYKTAAMLSGEARGLGREEAIINAHKVFVDMDNMSAVERTYLKQVMPFYAFTKHLFRYLLTYPTDHPYAASILTRFANQAEDEWKSGLPQAMMTLFHLGEPDANGNITAIDLRSMNPFRSLYSDFTLGGVLSQLSPQITLPFQIAGMNILSASPELYPQLQWDPQTGQYVAVHDTQSAIYEGLNAIVPEFGAVDHFFALTDRMKALKQNDPEGYARSLWSSLNLPFAMSQYNMPYEYARNEMKRYTVAGNEVSQALASGDFSLLRGYDRVPVPSYLQAYTGSTYATPAQIEAVWQTLSAHNPPGVSVKATLPRNRRRTR